MSREERVAYGLNIHELPKPPQRVPSLLTHILNTLAYQNNNTCINSKMREEEDTVTYENKHHMGE